MLLELAGPNIYLARSRCAPGLGHFAIIGASLLSCSNYPGGKDQFVLLVSFFSADSLIVTTVVPGDEENI